MMNRLVFGCGHLTGGASQSTASELVQRCIDSGIIRFDTAPSYGLGVAERALCIALGRAPGGGAAMVNTKFGLGRPRFGYVKSYLRMARRRLSSHHSEARFSFENAMPRFGDPCLPRGKLDARRLEQALAASERMLGGRRVDTFFLHEAYKENLTSTILEELAALRGRGRVERVGLANGCVHGAALDSSAPPDFVIQAAAPPSLFTRDVTLSRRHIVHSVYTSFRARCRIDAAFGSAAQTTIDRFGDIFGAGSDAEIVLAFLLAGEAAPEASIIFATEAPSRLQRFLAAITKAARSGASIDAPGYFCDRLAIAQDRW